MPSNFTTKPLSTLILSSVLCIYPAAVLAQNTVSSSPTKTYSIPSQPLSNALTKLGIEADLQIVFPSNIVRNLIAPSLNGDFTLTQAFDHLLQNTDLTYEFISKTSVVIIRDEPKKKSVPKITKPKPAATISQQDVQRPADLEVVLVTGSRLPRSPFDSLYPTQAVKSMVIKDGGHTTIAGAIDTLPIMCEPNFSLNNLSEGNLGEAYGDLYCLGSQRTLSLINSRRSVSSNEPTPLNGEPGLQVDLNMIPRIMVDSIEIIGVGSAPVYGSDAIGGTVNILLKNGVQGFELDAQGGISDFQDGEQGNIGILFGKNFLSDRGNFTLGYEYHKQEEVLAKNRSYTASNFDYVGVPADIGAGYDADFAFVSDLTNPLLTREGIPTPRGDQAPRFATGSNVLSSTNGEPLTFDAQGRLRRFNPGETTLDLNTRIGGDGIRSQDTRLLRIPAQRHSLAGTADIQILDNLRGFVEFQYYRGEFDNNGRNREVVSSELNPTFNSLPLRADNPFLDPADSAFLQAQLPSFPNQVPVFYLHKDWSDVFDPKIEGVSTVQRIVAGTDGEFSLADRQWQWELNYNRGRSESENYSTRVNLERFEQAVGAARANMGHSNACLDPCVPLNPFGLNQDPVAVAYVTTLNLLKNEIEQQIFNFSVRGELLSLNGGPLQIVLGAEAREEIAMIASGAGAETEPRLPEPTIEAEDLLNNTLETPDRFSTKEAFVESIAPIVGDSIIPGVEKFELEANWRGVDHSEAGDDDAWSLGARLTLAPQSLDGTIVFRSNLTSSIRSPSILELFQRNALVPTASVQDPCDKDFVNNGSEAAMRKRNCIREASLNTVATPSSPPLFAPPEPYDSRSFESQVPLLAPLSLSGTRNLINERARATTAGLAYQSNDETPIKFSFDAIDIEVRDAITLRDLQGVLEDCYDRGDQSKCADIKRTSNFQLFAINNSYENIGRLNVNAFQYTFEYAFSVEKIFGVPGNFSFNMGAYQLRKYVIEDASGIEDRTGNLRFPKWRTTSTLGYEWGRMRLAWSTLYTSQVEINTPRSDAPQRPKVDAYFFHTLATEYELNDYFSARFNVQNILDSSPPQGLPSKNSGNTYDAVGRYFSLGINFQI